VLSRLGILKAFAPFAAEAGVGESSAAWDFGCDGFGECIGDPKDFGGDLGDWTMTFGGDLDRDRDLVGDLGAKAIMDDGRGFGLLQGARSVCDRGVTEPAPLRLVRLGELRPSCSLGMSSDLRPASRLLSSATARRSFGAGERWRGVTGAVVEDLFALSMFSKRARRSDTGFCIGRQRTARHRHRATYNGRAVHVLLLYVLHVCESSSSAGTRRYPMSAHRPSRRFSHWAVTAVVEERWRASMRRSAPAAACGVVKLCGDVPARYGMAWAAVGRPKGRRVHVVC
jgi:hypothetical protein